MSYGYGYGYGYGGAPQMPQWGGYGAAPGFGGPAPAYGGGFQGQGQDPVRTVFISGFPADIKERELNNMLRYLPGYIASQMTWKGSDAHGFAIFETPALAVSACTAIQGVQFDENCTLRCEMARKNMFTRDDGHAAQGGGKRPRFESGSGARTYDSGAGAVALGGSAIPGDNPPCSTLFIGNLADAVREEELTELFQAQPGFKQLKVVRGQRATTAFAEFSDVASAMAVHQQLQGATVPSSDRGGIRIQYSKNPFGKRKDAPL